MSILNNNHEERRKTAVLHLQILENGRGRVTPSEILDLANDYSQPSEGDWDYLAIRDALHGSYRTLCVKQ